VAKLKEVGTLSQRGCVRSSKYLSNLIEQDYRRIKQRIRPMLGFKRRLALLCMEAVLGRFRIHCIF
jgi:transposase-like protein